MLEYGSVEAGLEVVKALFVCQLDEFAGFAGIPRANSSWDMQSTLEPATRLQSLAMLVLEVEAAEIWRLGDTF